MSSLKASSLKNNAWKLGILSFGSGAIVMALEIVSSRILTPVFGSSTYTWGSLIGVILTGLSLGYFIGGKIADRNPTLEKICSIVFASGLFITIIPFLSPSIVEFAITVLPGTQYTAFVATFLLLIFPSSLLGFVSPYMIKLGAKALHNLGNISGSLYAMATLGSIVGTFSTVFFILPSFEVSQIIFALGVALIILSLIGLKKIPKMITIGIIIILLLPWSSFSTSVVLHKKQPIYETETPYSHLDVIDYGTIRSLFLDGVEHSAMNENDPLALVIDYTDFFHVGSLVNPNIQNVLFVGGGGFSGPKNFLLVYPEVRVDVVEIDPEVIDVAYKYFELTDNPRLRIFNEDARSFLTSTNNSYDLIILDAYAPSHIPYHLITDEFFQVLDSKLNPDGIVISNVIGSLHGDHSKLFKSIYKTMGESFPSQYVFLTEDGQNNVQNIVLVAIKTDVRLDRESLLQTARQNSITYLVDDLEKENRFISSKIETSNALFLTDKFSSVENLLDPLTHQPYQVEDLTFQENQKPVESNEAILHSLMAIIWILWALYMVVLWKKKEEATLST
ncbi:MAG: hypothetical protein DWQ18_03575 [Crenarchaeota archaeon]|nr:MAG: hypothetical protein DWQ17_09555 [Thermoproteota archaeon]RDJ33994.1 MAG: hypothetical protein DWQ18_03575 [Thermoproteota archaeon]RDJ36891.1 MAG: hypothetical protein DWQ13_07040 [Thermoproteota archaeon]RDJ37573.1 MAG: hypothetical protein DWQ19_03795 [Thermoproteota archaeon]